MNSIRNIITRLALAAGLASTIGPSAPACAPGAALAIGGAVAAGVMLAPAPAEAQVYRRLSIDPSSLRWDRTCPEWDTLIAGGMSVSGHRIQCYDTVDARWEVSDGASPPSWSALDGSNASTLDQAHTAGATIAISGAESAVTINSASTNGTSALDVNGTGVVAGAVSANLVDIESSAAHTTTATVRALNVKFSGSVAGGTVEVVQVEAPANTDAALDVVKGKVVIQDGTLSVAGATTLTGAITAASNLTMSDGIFAQTYTGTSTAHGITANSVTTGKVVSATANGITTGDLFYGESSDAGITTGKFLRLNDGAVDVFTVGDKGATTIAGVAAGTDAFVITNGDGLISSGHLDIAGGNLTVVGDESLTGLLTIVPTASTTRGLLFTAAGARNAHLMEANITGDFSVDQFDVDVTGAPTADVFDVNIGGAGSGHAYSATVGAVLATGNLFFGNLASTCTGCGGLVLSGGSVARTTDLVYLEDYATGAGASAIFIDKRGNSAAPIIQVTDVAAGGTFANNVAQFDMSGMNVAAGGLLLTSGSRAFTTSPLTVDSSGGNAAEPFVEINASVAGAATTDADAVQVNVGAVDYRGYGLDVKLGATATLAGAVEVTAGGAARTVHLFDADDDGTDAGHVFRALKSAGTGSIFHGTFDGAGTGTGMTLAMSSNVAGTGLSVTSAATTGRGIDVSHTGAFASAAARRALVNLASSGAWDADGTNPTHILNIDQNTGAGAAGDFAARISATGANVEALHIDDGTSQFDEAVTIGVAGAPVAGTTLLIEAAPGTPAITIDASSAGQLPTQTSGLISVTVGSATASVRSIAATHTLTADVASNSVFQAQLATPAAGLTGSNEAASYSTTITGQAADTSTGLRAFAANFSSIAAASTAYGLAVTGTHDFTVSARNTSMVILPVRISAGAGDTAEIGAGTGSGAGNAGGALTVHGGDGAPETTGGAGAATTVRGGNAQGDGTVDRNGGTLNLWGGNAVTAGAAVSGSVDIRTGTTGTTDGTISLGIAGTTNRMLLTVPSAGGFSGVNTAAMAGTLRPTKVRWREVGGLTPINGAAAGVFGGVATRDMLDAALNDVAFSIPISSDVDSTADIVIGILWTSEAGADTTVAVWDVEYSCVADNAQTDTAFTSIGATNDTLTLSDEMEKLEFTIPNAAFADGDLCRVLVQRQGADANDTVTATVELLGVYDRVRSFTP